MLTLRSKRKTMMLIGKVTIIISLKELIFLKLLEFNVVVHMEDKIGFRPKANGTLMI